MVIWIWMLFGRVYICDGQLLQTTETHTKRYYNVLRQLFTTAKVCGSVTNWFLDLL